MNGKSSILLIYTGGTIGMKEDPASQTLRPFDFSQIMSEAPELGKFAMRIDSETFDPLIDSSDVEPSLWQRLARLINERYDEYDGFVILHGTDTMAYSASALSFMLEGLGKPVIFTGSQLPIGRPRTDGRENLISSVEIAASRDADGHATVPEVCIFFNDTLMRGNRATKVNATAFGAFASPNCPPLAEAGISIRYNRSVIRKFTGNDSDLRIHTGLDTRVSVLKLHPGLTPQIARHVICDPGIRAVILETYGSGNAISKPWFTDILREASDSGKILVNVTQCLAGEVDMTLYATGKALADCGVISGSDMTTEATLSKLFHLMGRGLPAEEIKTLVGVSLRGEISK
ncbi:MAG: type I asparaginase [Candidatus Cryptobacteroides sp.]|nr:type I asparaginase [Candidatus Cryptobacteroides sp.]